LERRAKIPAFPMQSRLMCGRCRDTNLVHFFRHTQEELSVTSRERLSSIRQQFFLCVLSYRVEQLRTNLMEGRRAVSTAGRK